MKHVHIYFAGVALLVATAASAQQVTGDAPAQYPQGLKVSLTDFAAGQYTATYERVLGSSTTVALSLGGIGYTREQRGACLVLVLPVGPSALVDPQVQVPVHGVEPVS